MGTSPARQAAPGLTWVETGSRPAKASSSWNTALSVKVIFGRERRESKKRRGRGERESKRERERVRERE